MVVDMENDQLKELEKLIAVNKVPSLEPFQKSVAPVYDAAKKKYGATIIDKILNIK